MGLTITTELYTDSGVSNDVYINIESIKFEREHGVTLKLNNYLNKDTREKNKYDQIMCRRLYDTVLIKVENQSSDFNALTSESIHSFSYTKLKEKLISDGLTVEDDL